MPRTKNSGPTKISPNGAAPADSSKGDFSLPIRRERAHMEAVGQNRNHLLAEVPLLTLTDSKDIRVKTLQMGRLDPEDVGPMMLALDPAFGPGSGAEHLHPMLDHKDSGVRFAAGIQNLNWSIGGGLIEKIVAISSNVFAMITRPFRRRQMREVQQAEAPPEGDSDYGGDY